MALVREAVSLGRAARRAAGRKVRQPLAAAWVRGLDAATLERHGEHLLEEVNVKTLRLAADGEAPPAGWTVAGEGPVQVALDVELTDALRREGLARELVRHIQAARKAAGLQVDDRVAVTLQVDDGLLTAALAEHGATIAGEVLAVRLERGDPPAGAYEVKVKVEGTPITLGLEAVPE
jgi:isoleucyl-tRNA synthetase